MLFRMWREFYCSGVCCFLCPSTKVWGRNLASTLTLSSLPARLYISCGLLYAKKYLFMCPGVLKVLFIEMHIFGNGSVWGFFFLVVFLFYNLKNDFKFSWLHPPTDTRTTSTTATLSVGRAVTERGSIDRYSLTEAHRVACCWAQPLVQR